MVLGKKTSWIICIWLDSAGKDFARTYMEQAFPGDAFDPTSPCPHMSREN